MTSCLPDLHYFLYTDFDPKIDIYMYRAQSLMTNVLQFELFDAVVQIRTDSFLQSDCRSIGVSHATSR